MALCLGAGAAASAQTPAPAPTANAPVVRDQTTRDGASQRIERIELEDAGNRIDELRVGGQTQHITVQPKTGTPLPAYEVRANDGARARPGNFNQSDSVTAPRVWNLRQF